jgi:hypothetical protein
MQSGRRRRSSRRLYQYTWYSRRRRRAHQHDEITPNPHESLLFWLLARAG